MLTKTSGAKGFVKVNQGFPLSMSNLKLYPSQPTPHPLSKPRHAQALGWAALGFRMLYFIPCLHKHRCFQRRSQVTKGVPVRGGREGRFFLWETDINISISRHINICIYIYINNYIHIRVCMYICECLCICTGIRVRLRVRVRIRKHLHLHYH